MLRKKLLGMFVLLGLVSALASAALPSLKSLSTLGEGNYSAKVKAMVCSGCGSLIEKTLTAYPGIETVAVDSAKKLVNFKVKKGSMVNVSALQSGLKGAADKMGMGADFSLSEIKKLAK